ncbi:MAG: alpha/beta hydrolase [Phycisphaerales bacterium JB043]
MDRLLDALPGLFLLLGTGFVLSIIALTWYTYHRLRTPPRRTAAWAVSRGIASTPDELDTTLSFTDESLTPTSGWWRGARIPYWDIEGLDRDAPVLVITPGWGDSRVGSLRRVERLASSCSRIIAWDPPGLGEAGGRTTLGVHEPALLLELCGQLGTPLEQIVLYGSSMGAGISIAASAHDDTPLRGVIAEAPYIAARTPAYNVLRESGIPWRINGSLAFALLGLRLGVGAHWNSFSRLALARALRCPLLVIHGTVDTTCPLDDARQIVDHASHASLIEIDGAGHNNMWSEEPYASACADACERFIRELPALTGIPVSSSG